MLQVPGRLSDMPPKQQQPSSYLPAVCPNTVIGHLLVRRSYLYIRANHAAVLLEYKYRTSCYLPDPISGEGSMCFGRLCTMDSRAVAPNYHISSSSRCTQWVATVSGPRQPASCAICTGVFPYRARSDVSIHSSPGLFYLGHRRVEVQVYEARYHQLVRPVNSSHRQSPPFRGSRICLHRPT